MRLLIGVAAALFSTALAVAAADVAAVLKTPQERVKTADFRASGHLVRVDADGKRTSDSIIIKAHWFPGVLRVLVEVSPSPTAKPDTRAHILLEMRPSGQNVIKIAHPGDKTATTLPFEKWSDGPLGPVFSFEDFLEMQYFWPGQVLEKETTFGARDCNVLKSTPGTADKTHYAEIKTWLDQSIGFPVYVEKTLKGTGTVKEFTYFGLRHDGGIWSASQVESKIRGQSGTTLLIIDRGSAKANLGLGDFSPEQLTRF
ncbi:MAG: outer membrane lipoprotein-sorting protein [Terracidiphilus sp.]|jgi:hypothetical protein